MPSGPVQPNLPGFLSLLQLKNHGERPSVLSDVVTPVMDVTHWYGQDSIEVLGGRVTINRNLPFANQVNFTTGPLATPVPQNECWWVEDFSVELAWNNTTTAMSIQHLAAARLLKQADSLSGRGRLVGPSAAPFVTTGLFASAVGFSSFSPSLTGFWAPGGSNLGAVFLGLVTDPTTDGALFGTASIVRLTV